ncbi:hypothetical protein AAMO2058_001580700 [Amorphochlora amoebiformis]|eukprot:1348791-Amorphochlora_amoeboformis.AAC.1
MKVCRAVGRVGRSLARRRTLICSGGQYPRVEITFRAFHSSRSLRQDAAQQEDEIPEDPYKPTKKVKALVEAVMQLNMYESLQFVNELKDKFGVTDEDVLARSPWAGQQQQMQMMQQPVMAAPAAAPAPAAEEAPKEEEKPAEKTEFAVKLKGFDAKGKIKVIKEVRAITGLGLKEAKETVEKSPVVIKEHLSKDEAEAMAEKIKAAGGEVELE